MTNSLEIIELDCSILKLLKYKFQDKIYVWGLNLWNLVRNDKKTRNYH